VDMDSNVMAPFKHLVRNKGLLEVQIVASKADIDVLGFPLSIASNF
jgi:hypothetical protein